MTLVSPPIHPASLRRVTFSGIPGWAQKEVAGSQRAVVVHNHPLNCNSGGSERLVSTLSLVGSVPTSAKESHGGR